MLSLINYVNFSLIALLQFHCEGDSVTGTYLFVVHMTEFQMTPKIICVFTVHF